METALSQIRDGRATLVRFCTPALGLVFVLQFAACVWWYNSGSGSPRSSTLLHFSDEHVDLGTVNAGSELSVSIAIENNSAVAQRVLRFESTCGCTVPRIGGSFLMQPGETKVVPLVVKPSAGGRMRNAIICVFDNGVGQLCRAFAIIEGDVVGMIAILVSLSPTGFAWATDDEISLDVLQTAITAGRRFPPLRITLHVTMTNAPKENMKGSEIRYDVETDWQSAFVSWSDTRPNDAELPRYIRKWSFNGVQLRYDPINPPALAAQVALPMTLAEASKGLGGGVWIDLRNIGVWPLPFATLRKDWVSRSDEFVRSAKEHALQIESTKFPDDRRRFLFRELFPGGSTKRNTIFEISEERKHVTLVVVENFKEDFPDQIQSKTSIITEWQEIKDSPLDYFPRTVEFSRIGSNANVVELETWKTLSVSKIQSLSEESLDWSGFELPIGRLIDIKSTDGSSKRFEWDGAKLVDWAPPAKDVLTAELPPKGIRLWMWLNALVAALLLTFGAVRLFRKQGLERRHD